MVCNRPLRLTQPSTLSRTDNEYRRQSAVMLCGRGKREVRFTPVCRIKRCVWQVELCDPSLTRAIPEPFRDEFLSIKRHTNLRLVYILTVNVCDRQCPSCGRDHAARCIGPHICCRQNAFCEHDTTVCHKENFVPTPCTLPPWPRCGPQSLCVTSSLCCNDGQYRFSPRLHVQPFSRRPELCNIKLISPAVSLITHD